MKLAETGSDLLSTRLDDSLFVPPWSIWTRSAYDLDMGHQEADWKYQERHLLDWAFAAIALGFVSLYAYWGVTSDSSYFLLISAGLFGWVVLFFTDYWEAILYVPAVVLTTAISVVWVLQGAWTRPIVGIGLVLNAALILVTSYLLVYEDPLL